MKLEIKTEFICKICDKSMSFKGIGCHFKSHNITIKEYYDKFLKNNNEGICLTCGKQTNFYNIKEGYFKFCNSKCANKNVSIQNKIKQTLIDKYGKPYVFQNKELLEKREKTYLEKYGVNNPLKNDKIKEQYKQTCIEKYGVDNPQKNNFIKLKTKLTNDLKYNSNNYHNIEQRETTCLKRYGNKNYLGSDDYLKNRENIIKNKLGVINPSQLHDIRVKAQQKYTYNNIKFDSSWEIAYYIWLKDNSIDFEYQPNISFDYVFNGKIHKYFPDFLVNDEYIELKSDHLYSKMLKENTLENAKYKCMKNINVKILLKNDILFYLNYIKLKYGQNYLKQFKNKIQN